MHVKAVIEQLGYPPNEVKVYLVSLQLGGSSITDIAEKVKLPRTSVTLIVESLHRKGLMHAYLERRRKVWVAENPEKLLIGLKEREAALKVILPELQSLRHETGAKPTVRTYSGVEEIKQIMNDLLLTKHNISAILAWDDWIRVLGKAYVDDFIETRARRFLKIRLLTPWSKTAIALKEKDKDELRYTQFLPNSISINNTNFIYANKVAIISLNQKRPVGILIEDEDIHHTMEVLFESLWSDSEKLRS